MPKATTKKKAPARKKRRMSASAARAEGAATQQRERSAKADAVHTGTVIRGDGKAVTVTVPKGDAPAPKVEGEAPTITIFRNGPGGSYRWRAGKDVSPKQYMARSQAERGALKACPTATIVHEPDPTKQGASQSKTETPDTSKPLPKSKRGRVSVSSRGDEKVEHIAAHWPPSQGHIAYSRDAKITWEFILHTNGNGAVEVWKAIAEPSLPETGVRKRSDVVCTGANAAGDLIKRITGKTARSLGLTLRPRKSDGAKASKPPRKASGDRKPSGLDLAAQVLADAKEPLDAKTIAERAIAAGWKTKGQTPHATLYAAMTREIAAKGTASRFRKIDRGQFAAGKGA